MSGTIARFVVFVVLSAIFPGVEDPFLGEQEDCRLFFNVTSDAAYAVSNEDSVGMEVLSSTVSQSDLISEPPHMLNIQELGLLDRSTNRAGERDIVGTYLLNDSTGDKLANIEENKRDHAQIINREILRLWLRGEGLTPTWNT